MTRPCRDDSHITTRSGRMANPQPTNNRGTGLSTRNPTISSSQQGPTGNHQQQQNSSQNNNYGQQQHRMSSTTAGAQDQGRIGDPTDDVMARATELFSRLQDGQRELLALGGNGDAPPQQPHIPNTQPHTQQPHIQQPHTQQPHTQQPHTQQPQSEQIVALQTQMQELQQQLEALIQQGQARNAAQSNNNSSGQNSRLSMTSISRKPKL